MDLTVVIPAYNEVHRIQPTLNSVKSYLDASEHSYEVIVVDDGSLDETSKVVAAFAQQHDKIRLISYRQNSGKGFAVRQGVAAARGELLLIDDADGSSPIGEIERLLNAIKFGADLAIGSRNLTSTDCTTVTSWHRKFIGNLFNFFVRSLLLPGINDTQCGFKLFKTSVAKELFESAKQNRFAFDIEILSLAKRRGFKTAEVPINWTNVTGSKVNLFTDPIDMFFVLIEMSIKSIFSPSRAVRQTLPLSLVEKKEWESSTKGS